MIIFLPPRIRHVSSKPPKDDWKDFVIIALCAFGPLYLLLAAGFIWLWWFK